MVLELTTDKTRWSTGRPFKHIVCNGDRLPSYRIQASAVPCERVFSSSAETSTPSAGIG